uniref:Uncharacterized protein n=1 Tax=Tanacetum cinerariifolium TaxID=118510 RepID=A0A6L2JY48_TANCI|nr:hypothetical protein [Tanacetum cinerariifolium]
MLAIQAEEGEGSGHPSEPQPPPSTAQPTNDEPIPNVASSSNQKTQIPRQALHKDDKVERAATTAASLDAEQASGTINRTQSTTMPNVPLPQEIGVGGSPRLKLRVKKLEKKNKKARTPHPLKMRLFKVRIESSADENLDEDDRSKQGRSMLEEIDQDQPEDQLGVLSAAKVLADAARNVQTYTRRRRAVSIGNGGISTASRLISTTKESVTTAGASMPVSTAGMVQEIHINILSPVAVKDKDVGSSKRVAEAEIDYERSKRQKINEALGSVQEQPDKEKYKLSQEDLQQMMMVVPVEEDYIKALQRYMHDPLTWRLYDTRGLHHVSTDKGMDIFMLVEKEYTLSKGILTLMLVNKLLVDQHSEMANELLKKIFIQESRAKH